MNINRALESVLRRDLALVYLFLFFFFDSEVQFITPAGPRQSLLLAKDPVQHFWPWFKCS